MRPGEKLYEELLLSENPVKTKHPKIFRSKEPFIQLDELIREINSLQKLMQKMILRKIRSKLKKIVIDYSPSSGIIDHTFKKGNLNCFLNYNVIESELLFCEIIN